MQTLPTVTYDTNEVANIDKKYGVQLTNILSSTTVTVEFINNTFNLLGRIKQIAGDNNTVACKICQLVMNKLLHLINHNIKASDSITFKLNYKNIYKLTKYFKIVFRFYKQICLTEDAKNNIDSYLRTFDYLKENANNGLIDHYVDRINKNKSDIDNLLKMKNVFTQVQGTQFTLLNNYNDIDSKINAVMANIGDNDIKKMANDLSSIETMQFELLNNFNELRDVTIIDVKTKLETKIGNNKDRIDIMDGKYADLLGKINDLQQKEQKEQTAELSSDIQRQLDSLLTDVNNINSIDILEIIDNAQNIPSLNLTVDTLMDNVDQVNISMDVSDDNFDTLFSKLVAQTNAEMYSNLEQSLNAISKPLEKIASVATTANVQQSMDFNDLYKNMSATEKIIQVLSNLNAFNTLLSGSVSTLLVDTQSINKDIGNINTSIQNLKTDLGRIDDRGAKTEEDISKINSKIDKIKFNLKKISNTLHDKINSINNHTQKINSLDAKTEQHRKIIGSIVANIGRLYESMVKINESIDVLNDTVDSFDIDIDGLFSSVSVLDTDMENIFSYVGGLNDAFKSLSQHVADINAQIQKNNDKYDEAIANMYEQANKFREEYDAFVNITKQTVGLQYNDITMLMKKHNEVVENINDLLKVTEYIYEKRKKDKQNTKKRAQELLNEINKLKLYNEDMNTEITYINEQIRLNQELNEIMLDIIEQKMLERIDSKILESKNNIEVAVENKLLDAVKTIVKDELNEINALLLAKYDTIQSKHNKLKEMFNELNSLKNNENNELKAKMSKLEKDINDILDEDTRKQTNINDIRQDIHNIEKNVSDLRGYLKISPDEIKELIALNNEWKKIGKIVTDKDKIKEIETKINNLTNTVNKYFDINERDRDTAARISLLLGKKELNRKSYHTYSKFY